MKDWSIGERKTLHIVCAISVAVIFGFYLFTRNTTLDTEYPEQRTYSGQLKENNGQSFLPSFTFFGPKIRVPEVFPENNEIWDFFLASAYYYPTSESLGNNSVALVLSGHSSYKVKSITLKAWSGSYSKIVDFHLTPIKANDTYLCKWYPYLATAETLSNLTALTFQQDLMEYSIPFKSPVYEKHDVVTCVSPLFTTEQWQEMLFALHIYKQYGSHVHIYVRSMLTGLFELLRIYEKEGFATVESYVRYGLSSTSSSLFNPNAELEFRGQDAAQTDCLLKYKESATFISFMDLDDVIIPKYGSSYLEEFNFLFNEQPRVVYFRYQKLNAEYSITRQASNFNVGRMISSLSYTNTTEYGKYVIRPKNANSSWIHWPTNSHKMVWKDLSPRFIAITHLKGQMVDEEFYSNENFTLSTPEYEPDNLETPWYDARVMNDTNVMNITDLENIDREFKRMFSLQEVKSAMTKLPTTAFYGPLISACYKRLYYDAKTWEDWQCTNADRCKLPVKPGIPCVNTKGKYSSIRGDNRINLHFATETWFQEEDGCVP